MSDDRSTTDGANATAMLPTPRSGLIRSVAHRLAGDPPELPVEGHLPTFDGATGWLNSDPLTPEGLRGRVVLVDFWTYTCINWLRTAPYLRAWDAKYRDLGLTIIGVHTPEFGFEGNVDNVDRADARASGSNTRSRSTRTTGSGRRSRTISGPPSTSRTPRAASATTTSARASTR